VSIKRGVAAPCFGDDPMALVDLAVESEQAGFDGFFIWDHMTWSNDGLGPSIVDPWAVLSAIAVRTERIIIGPMITPVSRRRPWVLARQTVTLDLLAKGRTVFGVGLGSPVHGDFGIFGEETDNRTRARMLDEGLDLMARLWTGDVVEFHGKHFQVEPVRFTPAPFNGTKIPVWVGGVLPSTAGMRRAAQWDGAVPIRYEGNRLARPSAEDIAFVRNLAIERRGTADGFDLVVWAEVAGDPVAVAAELPAYEEAGTTWWIETARPPQEDWFKDLRDRISVGPAGRRSSRYHTDRGLE
jgi:alkanesulfonate monooxygenase SsuD/methylene tetrahydromethanopterin reductase-like flavin-dependent oxidoreductase (luciferase family)